MLVRGVYDFPFGLSRVLCRGSLRSFDYIRVPVFKYREGRRQKGRGRGEAFISAGLIRALSLLKFIMIQAEDTQHSFMRPASIHKARDSMSSVG